MLLRNTGEDSALDGGSQVGWEDVARRSQRWSHLTPGMVSCYSLLFATGNNGDLFHCWLKFGNTKCFIICVLNFVFAHVICMRVVSSKYICCMTKDLLVFGSFRPISRSILVGNVDMMLVLLVLQISGQTWAKEFVSVLSTHFSYFYCISNIRSSFLRWGDLVF